MKSLFVLVIIICFVSSCRQNTTNNNKSIQTFEINVEESSSNDISDHLQISKITPLETSDQSLVRRISSVQIYEKEVLVFDKSINRVFLFHRNGKFKRQIGNIGKGPTEYLEITDFCVSTTLDSIWIYDQNSKKILLYQKGGDFINSINVKSYFKSFSIWKNQQFVFYNRNTTHFPKNGRISNFCVFNFSGKLMYEDIFYTHNEMTQTEFYRDQDLIKLDNGIINLQKYFNDTIYVYNGKRLNPRFYLDFNQYNLPYDEKYDYLNRSEGDYNKFRNLLKETDYLVNMTSNWLETKDFIFTTRTSGKPALYYLLINKNNNKTVLFDFMKQDFIWRMLQIPIGITKEYNNENYLVFVVNPSSLLELNSKYKDKYDSFKEKHPLQGSIIENAILNAKINDNPYLVYVKIK